MLEVLRETAAARGIHNLEVLHEDIRTLPSLNRRRVDLVITTLALHHLPDLEGLESTMRRMQELLHPDGGFYIFDFGQLRSPRTRELLMAEAARTAPPITVVDYGQSLQAAFAIEDVLKLARACLLRQFTASSSSFVDFFFFLQTAQRTQPDMRVREHIDNLWNKLSAANQLEYWMLRLMRRAR
jgi:arsenite methyltransferase